MKVNSLQSAMDALLTHSEIHNVFVIGGAKLYAAALEHPGTCRLFITRVLSPEYDCDTFFPPIQDSQQWRQASYAELLKELELDKTVIGQQTEEKGAWWEPQLWIRS